MHNRTPRTAQRQPKDRALTTRATRPLRDEHRAGPGTGITADHTQDGGCSAATTDAAKAAETEIARGAMTGAEESDAVVTANTSADADEGEARTGAPKADDIGVEAPAETTEARVEAATTAAAGLGQCRPTRRWMQPRQEHPRPRWYLEAQEAGQDQGTSTGTTSKHSPTTTRHGYSAAKRTPNRWFLCPTWTRA